MPLSAAKGGSAPTLQRWEIDLSSGTVKEERLDDAAVEFPRLDERYTGQAYRYGYTGGKRAAPDALRISRPLAARGLTRVPFPARPPRGR
ncbi:MAG: carotenoid oxygenase family protein [Myxococcota bacterium]